MVVIYKLIRESHQTTQSQIASKVKKFREENKAKATYKGDT